MKPNGMSKIISLFTLLLVSSAMGLHAQALIVWPGDANNNGIANHVDLLHIGLYHNMTGPARNTISTAWAPQMLQTPWGNSGPALPDRGYADCDGSGVIDSLDILALRQNYGRLSGGFIPTDSGTITASGAPLLRLNLLDSTQIGGLVTLTLDILLGDSINMPADSIYGIAFTISYDQTLVDQINTAITGGWMNPDGRAQIIQNVDTALGLIEIAIVRTDGFAVNGSGSLGSLGIVMDDNIRVASYTEVPFEIAYLRGMAANGGDYYLRGQSDTLYAEFLTANRPGGRDLDVQVYPSPAHQLLQLRTAGVQDADLRIVDIRGVEMTRQHFETLTSHQLSVADWPAGVYFLELNTPEGRYRTKLCVTAGE